MQLRTVKKKPKTKDYDFVNSIQQENPINRKGSFNKESNDKEGANSSYEVMYMKIKVIEFQPNFR
jgi:hypothetical protein